MKYLKLMFITLLKILFIIPYSLIAIMPLYGYAIVKPDFSFGLTIIISILALIYVNWAIWTKGILKKIIMAIVMFCFLCTGAVFSDFVTTQSDYCIEDGECEEGYIYNGRAIDGNYCNELNGVWNVSKNYKNYCKIKYSSPSSL